MSEWTKERPTPGEWWLSIAPDRRSGFPAVIRCQVGSKPPWLVALYEGSYQWMPLSDEFFTGAQWKRVDPDPADPFA